LKKLVILAIGMMAFISQKEPDIKIFLAGDSTMSVKETSAFPETGWGMPFTAFWDSSVTIFNLAKNGRSTKTFINEGLWKSIQDKAGPGDYVFIQFGHNDESIEKLGRYTSPDSFTMNLTRFIKDTRDKKATPILITPVARRKFDASGKIMETHEQYSKLTREIAASQKVILIDLDMKSQSLYQEFGVEKSKLLFNYLKPGEHPNYPDGREDNTHFNELGARLIAEIILSEIRLKIPDLASHIVKPKTK